MFVATLVFSVTVNPVTYILNLAASATEGVKQEQIDVVQTTTKSGKTTKNYITLGRKPHTVYFVDRLSGPGGTTLQRWLFGSSQVFLYRPAQKEFIPHSVAKGKTLRDVLGDELDASFDQFIKILVLPEGMAEWEDTIKNSPGWSAVPGKPVLTINKGGSVGRMEFDPYTHRMTLLKTETSDFNVTWTMKYSPVKDVSQFKLPDDSLQVSQFPDPTKLPKMDAATAAVVDKALKVYEPVYSIAYDVTDPEGTTTVQHTRVGYYQKDSKATINFQQGILTIQKDGKTYSGQAGQAEVFKAVDGTGTRLEPLLRDFTLGINPIRRMLESTSTAKVVGSSKVNGDDCYVLQAKNDQITLTFSIRKSDNFILRTTTSLAGGINYKSSRDFKKRPGAVTLPKMPAPDGAMPLAQLSVN